MAKPPPLPVNVNQLDQMAAMGCQNPSCRHTEHKHEVYFHGRCHPNARVTATLLVMDGLQVLHVGCAKCMREIVEVGLRRPHNEQLYNKCHPLAGFDVRYVKGNGYVEVMCSKCERHAADLMVMPPVVTIEVPWT